MTQNWVADWKHYFVLKLISHLTFDLSQFWGVCSFTRSWPVSTCCYCMYWAMYRDPSKGNFSHSQVTGLNSTEAPCFISVCWEKFLKLSGCSYTLSRWKLEVRHVHLWLHKVLCWWWWWWWENPLYQWPLHTVTLATLLIQTLKE